jgi:hypothetical protein
MAAELLLVNLIHYRQRIPGRGRIHLIARHVQSDLMIKPVDVGDH